MLREGHRGLPQGPAQRRRSSSTAASHSTPARSWCSATWRARCAISRRRGTDGFYQGETAAALVAASKAGDGLLTQADLDAYRVRELRAARVRLPRVPHRLRAAAELGRPRVVRDAAHPRRLSARRIRLGLGARRALRDRSHAPRLRGSQSPARRSGVREQSDRATARPTTMPRRFAPASIRIAPATRRACSPASRHAKACTPRTTPSRTSSAMPCP